ncbi:hypothetical protein K7X08_017293 [Anisodus acutangulus]|uniref:Uncharacterized protein n=1 Tax=Anisodus acutangulus TaxID=402998 RepID=A0A9Q1R822_9SOLA|nr:hypothetical protein K7X08_017293 [Anisodus acutangulus]
MMEAILKNEEKRSLALEDLKQAINRNDEAIHTLKDQMKTLLESHHSHQLENVESTQEKSDFKEEKHDKVEIVAVDKKNGDSERDPEKMIHHLKKRRARNAQKKRNIDVESPSFGQFPDSTSEKHDSAAAPKSIGPLLNGPRHLDTCLPRSMAWRLRFVNLWMVSLRAHLERVPLPSIWDEFF